MNEREILSEIEHIERDFQSKYRRLEELLALLRQIRKTPPSRLRIIPGGLAGIAAFAALGTVANRARRHPAALVGAGIALGTAVLVLVAPQGGTAPTQQLSLPPAASFAHSLGASTVTVPPTASTPAPTATPRPATSPPNWVYLSPQHPTPTTSGTAPATPTTTTAAPPSTPPSTASYSTAPTPTPTATCTVEVVVHGLIRVCLT